MLIQSVYIITIIILIGQFMALESMAEKVRLEGSSGPGAVSSSNKLEKNASKSRGSGSPFKCMGLGLVQQMKSEKEEDLTDAKRRIEELETVAANRQKEVCLVLVVSTSNRKHN